MRSGICFALIVILAATTVADAAIFGENNLDDIDITQCESGMGKETPPTGRFFKIRDGRRIPMASGDVVHRADIVVTAAHAFTGHDYENPPVLPDDRVVFALYEERDGRCERVDYPVTEVVLGTPKPKHEPDLDFAVVRLARPVTSYFPLELATERQVDRVLAGEWGVALMGFAHHESTDWGKRISVVTCFWRKASPENQFYQWRLFKGLNNDGTFLHDCDTTPGMSGAAFTLIVGPNVGMYKGKVRDHVRLFLGIHQWSSTGAEGVFYEDRAAIDDEYSGYSAGVLLGESMRGLIHYMAGEVEMPRTAVPWVLNTSE